MLGDFCDFIKTAAIDAIRKGQKKYLVGNWTS